MYTNISIKICTWWTGEDTSEVGEDTSDLGPRSMSQTKKLNVPHTINEGLSIHHHKGDNNAPYKYNDRWLEVHILVGKINRFRLINVN